jgi:hypothetical protein
VLRAEGEDGGHIVLLSRREARKIDARLKAILGGGGDLFYLHEMKIVAFKTINRILDVYELENP